jgi:hypothetical protein
MFRFTFLLSLNLLSLLLRTLRLTWLYGALKLDDADRTRTVNNIGQGVVWTAVQDYLARVRTSVAAAMGVFVEGTTSDYSRRYKLPGGGRLQRRGNQSQTGAVKGIGQWDVAFTLEDFGAQIAVDDVAMAYMTAEEMQRHVDTVVVQDINTVRYEILKALLNNTARTFIDPIWGSLTVQPLALASDSVLYPPVLGSETEATDTHHIESGYAASAISDTNNPYVTLRDELEEHWGAAQGGSNIVAFINNAQVSKTEDLTDFDPVDDRFVVPGANTDTLRGLPANLPGRIIGRTNGVWVAEWRHVPANYIIAVHLDAPAPLIERVDPADTNLGTGLQLVSRDTIYPFEMSHWRHRFGVGVGNRIGAAVMELGSGGTYDIPSGFA